MICQGVRPHKSPAILILVTKLSITLSVHTDCQLSSFFYHYFVSHCQPTQVVNYYYCCIFTLSHIVFLLSVTQSTHTYCQLSSFLHNYSFSHCQSLQIVNYHHPCIIYLSHTVSPHRLSAVIILVSLLCITLSAHTGCQLLLLFCCIITLSHIVNC